MLLNACIKRHAERQEIISRHRNLHHIQSSGVIHLGTTINPVSYYFYRDIKAGFEYELLSQVAKQMGLKVEVKAVTEDSLLYRMLRRGEIDIAANSFISLHEKNNAGFTYSEPFLKSTLVMVRFDSAAGHYQDSSFYNSLMKENIYIPTEEMLHIEYQHTLSYWKKFFRIINIDSTGSFELMREIVKKNEGVLITTEHRANLSNLKTIRGIRIDPFGSAYNLTYLLPASDPTWTDSFNSALHNFLDTKAYPKLQQRYFGTHNLFHVEPVHAKALFRKGKISPYDELIKRYALNIQWDWRLVASIIYRESNFTDSIESPYGAQGLMQLVPETGRNFGASNLFDPEQNIMAGTRYIAYLQKYWSPKISDSTELKKFVLASYNSGLGHIIDARNLAAKYGSNAQVWDANVASWLTRKSDPKYYRDPVCKLGYCRGQETIDFVSSVMDQYNYYQAIIK